MSQLKKRITRTVWFFVLTVGFWAPPIGLWYLTRQNPFIGSNLHIIEGWGAYTEIIIAALVILFKFSGNQPPPPRPKE